MKRNAGAASATLPGVLFVCFHAGAQTPAPIDWVNPSYCRSDTTQDTLLQKFREEMAYALMRRFPSTYFVSVCVYRESGAFSGGSSSMIVTLDAENEQGLPTQPHPSPTSVTCTLIGDIPCKRVRQVQLSLPGTHTEAVRLPSAPTDNSKRVVAIVMDVAG